MADQNCIAITQDDFDLVSESQQSSIIEFPPQENSQNTSVTSPNFDKTVLDSNKPASYGTAS